MPIKDIKSYLVMSDGTESFVNRETGERIHYQQILNEFSSFKNTNGEFIKRRVGRAIEDLVKTNIYNTDDISVAGFYFSEEE
jgi:DNA-directed RNA polymerase delta subunit